MPSETSKTGFNADVSEVLFSSKSKYNKGWFLALQLVGGGILQIELSRGDNVCRGLRVEVNLGRGLPARSVQFRSGRRGVVTGRKHWHVVAAKEIMLMLGYLHGP